MYGGYIQKRSTPRIYEDVHPFVKNIQPNVPNLLLMRGTLFLNLPLLKSFTGAIHLKSVVELRPHSGLLNEIPLREKK